MVTALLHLFFMASFSWMLVEGLLLWSKVVSVNISEDRRMKLYYIIGWGKTHTRTHTHAHTSTHTYTRQINIKNVTFSLEQVGHTGVPYKWIAPLQQLGNMSSNHQQMVFMFTMFYKHFRPSLIQTCVISLPASWYLLSLVLLQPGHPVVAFL